MIDEFDQLFERRRSDSALQNIRSRDEIPIRSERIDRAGILVSTETASLPSP